MQFLVNISHSTDECPDSVYKLVAQPARPAYAGVAELADALDLGSSVERRAGSSPVSPTKWLRSTDGSALSW